MKKLDPKKCWLCEREGHNPECRICKGTRLIAPLKCHCGNDTHKITSGTPECADCWDWRKLDGPAARHWLRVSKEFLSNIDLYDQTQFFKKAGLADSEWLPMLQSAKKLHESCELMIAKHMPGDRRSPS